MRRRGGPGPRRFAWRLQVAFIDLGLPRRRRSRGGGRHLKTGPGERMVLAALTWYGQATDRRKTLEAGFDVHLVKPVELERVTEVLALARSRSPATRATTASAKLREIDDRSQTVRTPWDAEARAALAARVVRCLDALGREPERD